MRRHELERISAQLWGLELRLSYSLKASADFGLLVLSMRAESFHQALYESMGRWAGRRRRGCRSGPRRRSAPS
jgi:hypothetical protein